MLSTIACQLANCLSEEELAALSADLVVLGDMLANIIAKNIQYQKQNSQPASFPVSGQPSNNCTNSS